MCSDIAISVKHLTKNYRVFGHPTDRIKQAMTLGRMRFHREFTALQDVSFEIKKGETVGIIGRNGSGKSTLLQLICGILKPTSGALEVNGRISALLELGSGFNPDFTGRENVYFQGAIMGIPEEEMDSRFDEVVAFADIGEFIDHPVRTYSSGMFVRLAFAVAVNVSPGILIVDEALSVGDEAFQRKCFSYIQALQEQGCTILLVSHSAAAVLELCGRAILLDHGRLLAVGKPKTVLDRYYRLLYAPQDKHSELLSELALACSNVAIDEPQNGACAIAKNSFDPELESRSTVSYEPQGAIIRNPRILDAAGQQANILTCGEGYTFTYDVLFTDDGHEVRFSMLIKTISGYELGGLSTHLMGTGIPNVKNNSRITVKIPFQCHLLPGIYFLNSGVLGKVRNEEVFLHRIIDIMIFKVRPDSGLLAGGIINFGAPEKSPTISTE